MEFQEILNSKYDCPHCPGELDFGDDEVAECDRCHKCVNFDEMFEHVEC